MEALYDENQALLNDLLKDIELSNIQEVWDINFINTCKHHFILVLDGGIHFCTCMLVSTLGVVCRHYWKVMLESKVAAFHVAIIPQRWYNNAAANIKNPWNEIAIQLTDSGSVQHPSPSLKMWQQPQYKKSTCEEVAAKQQISQKLAYGMLHGECKHLINLALEEGYDLHRVLAQAKAEILAKREERLVKRSTVLSEACMDVQSELSHENDNDKENVYKRV